MEISPQDQLQIKAFIENQPMADAVRRVLMGEEEFACSIETTFDDALYGRAVKVWVSARALMRSRFDELTRIASRNPQPPPRNEAR